MCSMGTKKEVVLSLFLKFPTLANTLGYGDDLKTVAAVPNCFVPGIGALMRI